MRTDSEMNRDHDREMRAVDIAWSDIPQEVKAFLRRPPIRFGVLEAAWGIHTNGQVVMSCALLDPDNIGELEAEGDDVLIVLLHELAHHITTDAHSPAFRRVSARVQKYPAVRVEIYPGTLAARH